MATNNPDLCGDCRQLLLSTRFSANALVKYHDAVRTNRNRRTNKPQIRLPTCSECSPQQRSEMECYRCNKTKGLEDFSKAQRRALEKRCLSCQVEVARLDKIIEPDIDDHTETNSNPYSSFTVSSLASALQTVSNRTSTAGNTSTSNTDGWGRGTQLASSPGLSKACSVTSQSTYTSTNTINGVALSTRTSNFATRSELGSRNAESVVRRVPEDADDHEISGSSDSDSDVEPY